VVCARARVQQPATPLCIQTCIDTMRYAHGYAVVHKLSMVLRCSTYLGLPNAKAHTAVSATMENLRHKSRAQGQMW
jgi:hypothetical protein